MKAYPGISDTGKTARQRWMAILARATTTELLTNRRVRSAQDLTDALGLHVLGTVGSATGMPKRLPNGVPA